MVKGSLIELTELNASGYKLEIVVPILLLFSHVHVQVHCTFHVIHHFPQASSFQVQQPFSILYFSLKSDFKVRSW